MKFVFLSISNSKPKWLELFEAEMIERKIKPMMATELETLKAVKSDRSDRDYKKQKDTELLLKRLQPTDYVVLADEKGKEFRSEAFAKKLESIMAAGKKRIVYIIGGPFGVSDDLIRRADLCVQLSALTLNHHVAQMLLIEQVYRALAIQRNLPYHNE